MQAKRPEGENMELKVTFIKMNHLEKGALLLCLHHNPTPSVTVFEQATIASTIITQDQ